MRVDIPTVMRHWECTVCADFTATEVRARHKRGEGGVASAALAGGGPILIHTSAILDKGDTP